MLQLIAVSNRRSVTTRSHAKRSLMKKIEDDSSSQNDATGLSHPSLPLDEGRMYASPPISANFSTTEHLNVSDGQIDRRLLRTRDVKSLG